MSHHSTQATPPRTSAKNQSASGQAKRLRERRTVNVRLLALTAVVLALVAAGVGLLRQHRQVELAHYMSDRAEQLASEGEWRSAVAYLNRYLRVAPDDFDARMRLVEYGAEMAESGGERGYFIRLLRDTIAVTSTSQKRSERRLRLLLADQLFKVGQYKEAESEAGAVVAEYAKVKHDGDLDEVDREVEASALRTRALAAVIQNGRPGVGAEAQQQQRFATLLSQLEAAIQANPTDVALARSAATLCRQHAARTDSPSEMEERADSFMDALVKRDADNADALVARYRYRLKYAPDSADADLRAALAALPDHFEANLYAGMSAWAPQQGGDAEEAERRLRGAIAAKPEDPRGYIALARLLWMNGSSDVALEALEDASNSTASAVTTEVMRARILLDEGRLEQAAEATASAKEEVDAAVAPLVGEARRAVYSLLTSRLRLLEGLLNAARGEHVEAVGAFQAAAAAPVHDRQSGSHAIVFRRASENAAGALAKMGRPDQAAHTFAVLADRLADDDAAGVASVEQVFDPLRSEAPLQVQCLMARFKAAEWFLRAGQVAKTQEQLEVYDRERAKFVQDAPVLGPFANALGLQVDELRLRAALARQMDLPPGQRRWRTFLAQLDRVKRRHPESETAYLCELQYAQARAGEPSAQATSPDQLLAQGAERFAGSAGYWKNATRTHLLNQRPAEAEEALRRYLELETNAAKRTEAQVAFLLATDKVEEARQWLTEQREAASSSEEDQLLARLEVHAVLRSDGLDAALQKANQLVEAASDSRENLLLALDLAIAAKDWSRAEELEGKLLAADQVARLDVQYYRAVRLVNNYDDLTGAERVELGELVALVSTQRPRWVKAAALAAAHAEATRDRLGAIEAYERALDLGDRRTRTLERLSYHLYEEGQYERAQQVIDRLYALDNSVSYGAESLAISTAVRRDDLTDALRLAREAVDNHPDDAPRRLWLYDVLMVSDQPDEAGEVLAKAGEDFPDNELVWKSRVAHLAKTKNLEAADALLEAPPASLARNDFARHVALATGHELLGNVGEAREHYEAALRLKPAESHVRLRYANMLMRADPSAARQQLEQLVGQDPEHKGARRQLAAVLAAEGADADWDRINKLLGDDEGLENRRLRAVLLARRGRNQQERAAHCEEARRILTAVVEGAVPAPPDIDRLLLAGAYEQEALVKQDPTLFESARQQLRYVADRADAPLQNTLLYLNFLVRSIEALEDFEDASGVRELFLSDAKARLEDTGRALAEADTQAGSQSGVVRRQGLLGMHVRVLRAEGKRDEAVKLIADFANEEVPSSSAADRARLILGLGTLYSMLGAHDQAALWYRELSSMAPKARGLLSQSLLQQGKFEEAVALFIDGPDAQLDPDDAATLAGVLAGADLQGEALDRAWSAITDAMAKNPRHKDLLMAVAVLHVTRGEEDEAIELFREVVRLDPEDTLAINNLATLLGERESTRSEALDVIGRAIDVAGRKAALLDTQGTIQLQLGDASAAIASLEESVASVNVDPRYYFHLAAAYHRAGKREDAQRAMRQARARGIDKAVLTEADRELKSELDRALAQERTALNEVVGE